MSLLGKYKAGLFSEAYFRSSGHGCGFRAYAWLLARIFVAILLERGRHANTITAMAHVLREMITRFPINGFVGANASADIQDPIKGCSISYGEMVFIQGVLECERQRLWQQLKNTFRGAKVPNVDDAVIKAYEVLVNEHSPMCPEGYCFILLDRINRRRFEVEKDGHDE